MLIAFSGLATAWSINQWSVAYLGERLNSNPTNLEVTPPENHQRAQIWLAEEALEIGDTGYALALLQPLAKLERPLYLRTMGKALAAEGDFEAAIQIWTQAGDYQSLEAFAKQADETGDSETALLAYRTLSQVSLNYGALPFAIFLWNTLEDHNLAKNILREAIEMYPASPRRTSWLNTLGKILLKEKHYDESIKAYQEAFTGAAVDYWLYIDLGWAYYERGDSLEIVLQEFQKAIDLNNQRGNGYFAIGEVLANEGRYSEADDWFAQAIERNPEMKWWWLVRANRARSAGKYSLANQYYQEAISQFPDWDYVYYNWALNYKLLEDKANAQKYIEKALVSASEPYIEFYLRAGDIYEWVGNNGKALEVYRDVLLIEPTNLVALDATQRIEAKNQNK